MIAVEEENLEMFAPMLIQHAMFDCKGGVYSGLITAYHRAMLNKNITASFIMLTDIGVAISLLEDGKRSYHLYVHPKLRKKGHASKLTTIFSSILGDKYIEGTDMRHPVGEIVERVLGIPMSREKRSE
jgi:hypothetical protein